MQVPGLAMFNIAAFGFYNGSYSSVVPPNDRRTVLPRTASWTGEFRPVRTTESDVLTFDMTRVLSLANGIDAAETILTASVSIAVATGSLGADATPASRLIGLTSIEGLKVSQRFGNWQAIANIRYIVTASITTSRGNAIVARGYLSVEQ